MPTPWLVTRPPAPSRRKVATAVNSAKRCRARLDTRQIANESHSPDARNNKPAAAGKEPAAANAAIGFCLFGLEGQVHFRGRALFDLDLLSDDPGLAVSGLEGVLAGGDVFNLERA